MAGRSRTDAQTDRQNQRQRRSAAYIYLFASRRTETSKSVKMLKMGYQATYKLCQGLAVLTDTQLSDRQQNSIPKLVSGPEDIDVSQRCSR